jgi:mRNA deadenylase 3'-5' endonuclease subunit Ccr4
MRKVIEKQLKYWQVDISSIQIDLRSRDEIYQLLLGLRAIYNDRRICEEVFTIVRKLLK